MITKKIILISVLYALLISVGILMLNMFSFQSQLAKSLDVDKLYITCESRRYTGAMDANNRELELSPTVMCYEKNKIGTYNLICGGLSVYDNVLYHASIGSILGAGSKALLTEQEALAIYDEYFQQATKYIGTNESYKFNVDMYNYAAVTKSLKVHKTLFTMKSIRGNETEYRLYFGKSFYNDIIKYMKKATVVDFNKPIIYPVVVKFKNDNLTEISIMFNATIVTENQEKNYYYEYNLYYNYEKDFSITDKRKESPYSFYQDFEPERTIKLSTINFRDMEFINGKLYALTDNDGCCNLKIYDLKTSNLIKEIDLPQNAFNIVIHGECVYIQVNPNGYEQKVFCYNERTEESTLYDIPALKVFFVEDELVIAENGNKISCGNDWGSLVQTSKYDNASSFYYDNYSGNTYAQIEISGNKYLVKLTKDGVSNEKILLSGYSYDFTQEGIILRECIEYDTYRKCIHSKYFKFDSNLKKVKEWEVKFYDGDYLGETEDYIFYTTFVFDKKTVKYYGFNVDGYKRYAIFDGILYFNNGSAIFSTETLNIKNNY